MSHIRRWISLGVLLCALVGVTGIQPAAAEPFSHGVFTFLVSKDQTKQDAVCKQATKLRTQAIKKFGKRAPGRDICRYGVQNGRTPTHASELRYKQTLQRMVHPPPLPVAAPVTEAYSASPVSSGSGVPSCASESGTNYSTDASNTNPSSGATGRYQIIPSTHAALCSDLGMSPSEQDECAGRIYSAQGSGAWVGCG